METAEKLVQQTENILWVGETGFEAKGERICIRQDEHKSGYECLRCMDKDKRTLDGREVSVINCEACAGEGKRKKAGNANIEVKCSDCDGRGFMPCPDCDGKGTSTGIVLPESSKGEPTTGIVVSKGPDAKLYDLGHRVMFPSYSGNLFVVKGKDKKSGKEKQVRLRFINEGDVIAQLYGELEYRALVSSQALYTND